MVELRGVVGRCVGAVVVGSRTGRTASFVRFTSLILQGLQTVDVVGVVEPELHSDEGFTALDAQHVPGFGFGEKFADGALG